MIYDLGIFFKIKTEKYVCKLFLTAQKIWMHYKRKYDRKNKVKYVFWGMVKTDTLLLFSEKPWKYQRGYENFIN